jgi:HlyD family secretion protein
MQDSNKDHAASVASTMGLGKPASARHGKARLAWIGTAAVAVVLLIVWGTHRTTAPIQYTSAKAQRGALTVTVTATGNLQPTNQVDVGSELSGTVKSVAVDFNDRVKVGQVLARLDTTKLEAQVAQSRAALAEAQAKVVQAQATVKQSISDLARLRRVREMSGNKVPSAQDIDTAVAVLARAQADAASARAAVAQAQATLSVNETDLSKAAIRSPINGMVLTRTVEPGQTVAASLQAPVLFTLAEDLTKMELHVDVDEADVGQVRNGQAATFAVDAYPDREFPARITEVRYGAKTVSGVVTYETILNVDNSDLSLRPGMTATATVTVQKLDHALLVPNAALRFAPPSTVVTGNARGGLLSFLLPRRPGRPSAEAGKGKEKQQLVWTLRDGKPVAIPVTVGVTDGAHTEILGGDVREGMALLTDAVSAKQ